MLVSPCRRTKCLPFAGVKWQQTFSLLVGGITSPLSTTSQILWNSLNLDTTSHAVIQALKEQFSRHGILDTVVLDNGSKYSSQEFHEFSLSWEFNHVTSLPQYPRSNCKAESSVKAVKLLFKKAERDGKDPWLALLDYRNTPTEGIGASPAQRLLLRRTRTLLPTVSSLLRPEVSTHSTEKLEWKRRKAKFCHDRHSKQLPELEIGQEVRIAPLHKNKTWKHLC